MAVCHGLMYMIVAVFCRYRIEDIILSARKHRLTASLEQELLMDARDKGKFVIY